MEGPLQVRDPMGHAEESVEYGSPAKVGVENVMLRFVTPRRCGNEGLKLVHTGKDAKTDGSSWEPSVRCWIVPRFLILTRLKESWQVAASRSTRLMICSGPSPIRCCLPEFLVASNLKSGRRGEIEWQELSL